ncbi:MAG: AHH domain-containing protein [Alteraurantiacibacter sp.]
MQRHHLLPRQILKNAALLAMLSHLGRDRIGFDDFRHNGLLLPSSSSAARRVGLPLHRGPHRLYNAMVLDRIGQIEAEWSRAKGERPLCAESEAIQRLLLLQRALRRRLLDSGSNRLQLNRKDPFRPGVDFRELDAMAEQLWSATGHD